MIKILICIIILFILAFIILYYLRQNNLFGGYHYSLVKDEGDYDKNKCDYLFDIFCMSQKDRIINNTFIHQPIQYPDDVNIIRKVMLINFRIMDNIKFKGEDDKYYKFEDFPPARVPFVECLVLLWCKYKSYMIINTFNNKGIFHFGVHIHKLSKKSVVINIPDERALNFGKMTVKQAVEKHYKPKIDNRVDILKYKKIKFITSYIIPNLLNDFNKEFGLGLKYLFSKDEQQKLIDMCNNNGLKYSTNDLKKSIITFFTLGINYNMSSLLDNKLESLYSIKKSVDEIINRLKGEINTPDISQKLCNELKNSLKIDKLKCEQFYNKYIIETDSMLNIRLDQIEKYLDEICKDAKCYGVDKLFEKKEQNFSNTNVLQFINIYKEALYYYYTMPSLKRLDDIIYNVKDNLVETVSRETIMNDINQILEKIKNSDFIHMTEQNKKDIKNMIDLNKSLNEMKEYIKLNIVKNENECIYAYIDKEIKTMNYDDIIKIIASMEKKYNILSAPSKEQITFLETSYTKNDYMCPVDDVKKYIKNHVYEMYESEFNLKCNAKADYEYPLNMNCFDDLVHYYDYDSKQFVESKNKYLDLIVPINENRLYQIEYKLFELMIDPYYIHEIQKPTKDAKQENVADGVRHALDNYFKDDVAQLFDYEQSFSIGYRLYHDLMTKPILEREYAYDINDDDECIVSSLGYVLVPSVKIMQVKKKVNDRFEIKIECLKYINHVNNIILENGKYYMFNSYSTAISTLVQNNHEIFSINPCNLKLYEINHYENIDKANESLKTTFNAEDELITEDDVEDDKKMLLINLALEYMYMFKSMDLLYIPPSNEGAEKLTQIFDKTLDKIYYIKKKNGKDEDILDIEEKIYRAALLLRYCGFPSLYENEIMKCEEKECKLITYETMKCDIEEKTNGNKIELVFSNIQIYRDHFKKLMPYNRIITITLNLDEPIDEPIDENSCSFVHPTSH